MSRVMSMVEFLKTEAPNAEKAVARKFVEREPFFAAWPFETSARSSVDFNRQENLPSTTNRAVGELYGPSQGQIDIGKEPMKIQGGIAPFDSFQMAIGDGSRRTIEAEGFVESVARNYIRDVFKGNDDADPRIIRGLQLRQTILGKNLLTQTPGPATLLQVSNAVDLCRLPTHIAMGKSLRTRFSIAANNSDVGGYITRGEDAFNREVMVMNDLPVLVIGEDASDTPILDFTEASDTTSLYILSLGPEMTHGIQVAAARIEDLGRDPSTGQRHNLLLDWFASIIVRHSRAAVRYSNITNAPVTRE